MDIVFSSNKLEKEFNSDKELNKTHGKARAKAIAKRMIQLLGAENLEQLRNAPGNCHLLKENLSGTFTLDLDGPYRLLFKPFQQPPAKLPDGSIDWALVTSVVILEVRNTHE